MNRRAFFFIGIGLIVGVVSCQKIKTKLGIGDTIKNPNPGTPEYTIQAVLRSASNSDSERGWEEFSRLLHSNETSSPVAMNDWRTMRFPAIRRKVKHLLLDPNIFSFKVMDRREYDHTIVLYLQNKSSDMPTPCKLKRDPKQGNTWKVYNSCF